MQESFIKNCIISVIILVLTIAFVYERITLTTIVASIWIATMPFGWSGLNRITPTFFLFLPLVGWLFYFVFKAILAIFVGPIELGLEIWRMNHA